MISIKNLATTNANIVTTCQPKNGFWKGMFLVYTSEFVYFINCASVENVIQQIRLKIHTNVEHLKIGIEYAK